ncbi:hypothetical protein AJ80_01811 [Polytolypa hystricis UAMH7299]|uniref:Probable alpha/beta-glucosidase agdC n=1 Tax=Polytolypa hystricis (strain UAMH7299) TaxID=1447883 RepID=A0A2B7Z0Y9_POLH7|nr:hypothetical protein AJ80_01811 [Polytolypa hystricis UAMH7299]
MPVRISTVQLTVSNMLALSALLLSCVGAALAVADAREPLGECPGYSVTDIHEAGDSLTADLKLAGEPCNTYGKDVEHLKLKVEYQTDSRLHIMIYDADEEVYQVPESVLPRPAVRESDAKSKSQLKFSYKKHPFSFSVSRRRTHEELFDTKGSNLIFQNQYLNLKTRLPHNPNLYGLGEHSDSFRLNTTNYTRTLWNRDSYGIPSGSNLYGSHPIYVDHRMSGTHGVFFLNSNGMDIKINTTEKNKQYLEYNVLGGVIDLYFLAGPTPKEVASQYASVVGLPVMMPYWGFGFHQCRYGYRDIFDVAEVVSNYSVANIPLETMWTDIDYMDRRKVFTLDPDRFPIERVQSLVDHLHKNNQHYIVMVDPAVSYSNNGAFNRGVVQGVFLKKRAGDILKGAVWPGVTAFPDWFHPNASEYWSNEFSVFFNRETGVNIDGLWIDMNEPANFCDWPCEDPEGWARDNDLPPEPPTERDNPRRLPGLPPIFQPDTNRVAHRSDKLGLLDRDLVNPPYEINNDAGSLSNKTLATNTSHANGLTEYDTHNLYGSMMSIASRQALLQRRPSVRPMVITRSTFAGAGAHVGKWLGDNLSTWEHYRISIAQMLSFASIFQMPMVGSDVCGFGGDAEEALCARWAMLGAFYPFYRNHNEIGSRGQEFYRWWTVAEAARKAIDIRYRLLDYIYTALHQQSTTGEPLLNPMFYIYPKDKKVPSIDLQFFYGDSILVSPVTEQGSTSVDIYLPKDIFYDFYSGIPVHGKGKFVPLTDISLTQIPLHIRGGSIIPMRSEGAQTTKELRDKSFTIVIAPDTHGKATGRLYIDDGNSIEQPQVLDVKFSYHNGVFRMEGQFALRPVETVKIKYIRILGQKEKPHKISKSQDNILHINHHSRSRTVAAEVDIPLTRPARVKIL